MKKSKAPLIWTIVPVVFFLLAGIFLAATAYYYDELIYGIVLIVFGLINIWPIIAICKTKNPAKLYKILGVFYIFFFTPSAIAFFVMKPEGRKIVGSSSVSSSTAASESSAPVANNPAPAAAPASEEVILTSANPMDQILELKQLLDEGKITQDQYNSKISTLL